MARMTGGRALVEMLTRHGVDKLFAWPGVQNDALFGIFRTFGDARRPGVHSLRRRGPGSGEDALSQKIMRGAAIHRALVCFEPIDVALDGAGAPGLGDGTANRR